MATAYSFLDPIKIFFVNEFDRDQTKVVNSEVYRSRVAILYSRTEFDANHFVGDSLISANCSITFM